MENAEDLPHELSEMAELDLDSLAEETLPEGHRSGLVALVGRPNVGKSTLMNAIMRQKIAIVSPRPQTTRANQLGIASEPEYQIIFVDTPGLVQPRHKLDEFMVATAQESIRDADVILWLVDGSEPPGPADQAIARLLKEASDSTPIVMGINKADLLRPEEVIPRTDAYRGLLPKAQWLFFSARNGDGLGELMEILVAALPEGPRYYPIDQTTDFFIRDIAGELVREQIFLQMRDEVPYGTAVRVERFKVRENGVTYINATIFVERENHKKMLIGANGAQLRKIGSGARREIEKLIDGKVYLELWVKVQADWRRDEQALERLGYSQ